jgi:lipoprotein NlpI
MLPTALAVLTLCGLLAPKCRGESPEELLKQARAALAKGDNEAVVSLAGKAIVLDPQAALAYQLRGQAQFKLARFIESVADFDKFLELRPAERPGHWQRGISCYYAGQFEEGREQFAAYEKVDTNDVENAVWHFLCLARKDGIEKARASLLKIGKDKRVPMMQVYELFAGRLKPDDVLTAARAGPSTPAEQSQRLFYAHLYLGLYYEVAGDKKQALEHLNKAVGEQKTGPYMWDVARVHRDSLRKAMQRTP